MFKKNYARYYEVFNESKPYKREAKFVYDWAGKPKSILDIGCGTANYWKHFTDDDIRIMGFEKSEAMIAKSEHKDKIVCGDVQTDIIGSKHKYDTVTALFDVLNYMPTHNWWKKLPLKQGGFFIFDIWDNDKVQEDGFSETKKMVRGVYRKITPIVSDGKYVDLNVHFTDWEITFQEIHRMYIYSDKDIEMFCGNEFKIVDTKKTKTWQKFYKLIKK